MAHMHTILKLPDTSSNQKSKINNPQSSITPPAIDTPLLTTATHATFHRRCGITKKQGWVYPQLRSLEDTRPHPEFFYVEWPAASEDFREIHAPTLAAISGNKAPANHCFRLHEVAGLIAAMHTIPVPALLQACRPKHNS